VPCHYWPAPETPALTSLSAALPSRKSPASVLRLRCCCELLSSTTHTPPVCRHERRCRLVLRVVALARSQALLLPRRQHSGNRSRRSPNSPISISIASWPEKARPRPLTRPHRSNVNVKSSHAQQQHRRLDTTSPHHIVLAPPLVAKLSLAPPAPHSLRRRRWSVSASVVVDRLSLFRLARVFAIAFLGPLCTFHLAK
jgi:hypothetical protein